jgi:uncharacterized protein DUF839
MNEMQTRPSKRLAISRFLGITASLAALSAAASEDCFTTSIKPYTVSVSPDYIIKPLLSAGDRVPLTGDPTKEYQMIGIPDGLGAHRAAFDRFVLYMNHELTKGTMSEPNVGGSLNRGAFVSRWLISDKGCVLSGKRAYDTIYDEEKGLMLPAPDTSNITPDFSRFCSGSLAWQEAGFDRPIYFCGEESNGAATFDGKGGLGVCIFQGSSGGELHTMPWLGRVAWENASVQPKDGRRTVLIGMEDGPSSPDSQLYLHVGQKNGSSGATVLQRNGLDAGMKTYVLVSATAGNNDEVTFQDGTIDARWIELSNVAALTDVELEAASDAVGAFGFIRTEDGAFSKTDPNVYYFVTTGGATGNTLGRLYKLELNRNNVTGPCTLRVIYNADQIIAAGGDIAISPDNMDTSADYIMIVVEDGQLLIMRRVFADGDQRD